MRNIMQPLLSLNPRGRIAAASAAALLAGLLLLCAGCGGESGRDAAPAPAAAVDDTGPRPIVFDTSALDAWLDLADRLAAGDDVPSEDFAALLAMPAYRAYTGQQKVKTFNPQQFEYCLRDLFSPAGRDWAEAEGRVRSRVKAPGPLEQNFTYLKLRRADIAAEIKRIAAPGAMTRIFDRAAGFIPETAWPDTVTIAMLAGLPTSSLPREGLVLLDAGLALAAGAENLPDMLAAHFYANLQPMPGPLAMDLDGPEALAATLRQLPQEAAFSWLHRYPEIMLDSMHPTFAEPDNHQLRYREFARGSLERCDQMLEPLFASDELMAERGDVLDDLLRVNNVYSAVGYAMAEAIVGAAGEPALQACHRDAAAFLKAYQKAVEPVWSAAGPTERASLMPPFSPANLTAMIELLDAHPVDGPAAAAGDPNREEQ